MTTTTQNAAHVAAPETKLNLGLLFKMTANKFNKVVKNKSMEAEYANNHGSDSRMHKGTTRLIPKQHIAPIQRIESALRKELEVLSLPWEDRGNRLVPAGIIPRMQNVISKYRRLWDKAVEEFVVSYDDILADAATALNGDFRASNYPTPEHIHQYFRLDVVFMPLPDNSRLMANIRDEMEDIFSERIGAAADTLRERFIDSLNHLANRCRNAAGEDAGKFYASNLTNVLDLVRDIPDMFVGEDRKLENAIREATIMLDGVDVDLIKGSAAAAEDVAAKAKAIAGALL